MPCFSSPDLQAAARTAAADLCARARQHLAVLNDNRDVRALCRAVPEDLQLTLPVLRAAGALLDDADTGQVSGALAEFSDVYLGMPFDGERYRTGPDRAAALAATLPTVSDQQADAFRRALTLLQGAHWLTLIARDGRYITAFGPGGVQFGDCPNAAADALAQIACQGAPAR